LEGKKRFERDSTFVHFPCGWRIHEREFELLFCKQKLSVLSLPSGDIRDQLPVLLLPAVFFKVLPGNLYLAYSGWKEAEELHRLHLAP
jgi:hypothetical protein